MLAELHLLVEAVVVEKVFLLYVFHLLCLGPSMKAFL